MKTRLTYLTVAALLAASVFSSCKKDDDSISGSELQNNIVYVADSQGHEFEAVDMGFITKVCWGTCNMGATSPENSGDFYAWGETQPKDNFTWNNYRWSEDGKLGLTKYYASEKYGRLSGVDNKTVLEAGDDCVKATRGGSWRMPSKDDFSYLISHSTVQYCKLNGIWGYKFTSTVKGFENSSIFMPFSGMMDTKPGESTSTLKMGGRIARYWLNSCKKSPSYEADVLELINTDEVTNTVLNSQERYIGLPVRPVAVVK